jgi:hypothetical protein
MKHPHNGITAAIPGTYASASLLGGISGFICATGDEPNGNGIANNADNANTAGVILA